MGQERKPRLVCLESVSVALMETRTLQVVLCICVSLNPRNNPAHLLLLLSHFIAKQTTTWKLRGLPNRAQLTNSRTWVWNPCPVFRWRTGLDPCQGRVPHTFSRVWPCCSRSRQMVCGCPLILMLSILTWFLAYRIFFSNFLEVVQVLACLPYYFFKNS